MNLRGKQKRLIKVSILQNADETTGDVKEFIEQNSDIQVVQEIGRVLVLFKVSSNPKLRELSQRVKRI